MLAAALGGCQDLPWTLTIVGDGPCRDEVRSLFSRLPSGRVDWLGERSPDEVPANPGRRQHLCLAGHRRSLRPRLSGSAGRGPSRGRAGCRRRSRSRARWRDWLADASRRHSGLCGCCPAAAVRSRLAPRNGRRSPAVRACRAVAFHCVGRAGNLSSEICRMSTAGDWEAFTDALEQMASSGPPARLLAARRRCRSARRRAGPPARPDGTLRCARGSRRNSGACGDGACPARRR